MPDLPPEICRVAADAIYRFSRMHRNQLPRRIISDFVKAWIDPEGIWPAKAPAEATARVAMDETFARLDNYARKLRS